MKAVSFTTHLGDNRIYVEAEIEQGQLADRECRLVLEGGRIGQEIDPDELFERKHATLPVEFINCGDRIDRECLQRFGDCDG